MHASSTRAEELRRAPRLLADRVRLPARPVLAVAASVGLAALSLLFPSTPTYDPWAWILWGRELVELDLDTLHGPSWKPLPVLFTAPFALFGDAAPDLWLVVARAGAILAVVLAFRVARRLAGGGAPGVLAGLVAAFALVLADGWIRNAALGNSEGLLVALALSAVDRHLDGARTQALVLGFAAGLLRPEVWPFLGLYGVFVWVTDARRRALVAALALVLPVLWFVPDLVATGDLLRSSERAQDPVPTSPAFAPDPALEVLDRARKIPVLPATVGVVVALAFAVLPRRREATTLVVVAAAVVVVAMVAVMTEAGYSGNLRYLLLPAGLVSVVGGVGWGRLAERGASVAARAAPAARRIARPVLAAVLGALALALAVPSIREVPDTVSALEYQGRLYADLENAADAAKQGGVTGCGGIFTGPYHVPAVAWHLHLHFRDVGLDPTPPGAVFRAPTTAGKDPEPEISLPFVPVLAVGEWDVLAACPGDPAGA